MQAKLRMEAQQVLKAKVIGGLARSIIESHDGARHILKKNGGSFGAEDSWCQKVLHDLGYSKRRCTIQASKLPADWEHQGSKVTHQVLHL